MKLTTEQLKKLIKEEMQHLMQEELDMFNQGLRDAREVMPNKYQEYNEGYDEGSQEMEQGDIEDEQTYARGPYGEM